MQQLTEIKNYIKQITKGLILISDKEAKELVDIVRKYKDGIEVRKEKYNSFLNTYEPVKTFQVSEEHADQVLTKFKKSMSYQGFYRYYILDRTLYTVNPNLFNEQ